MTTTTEETLRDILNKADPNEISDAFRSMGGLGELLSILLDNAVAASVPGTTVGAAVTQTSAAAAQTGSASSQTGGASTLTGSTGSQTSAVSTATVAVNPAGGVYAQADQTVLAQLANDLQTKLNLCVADITSLTTKRNLDVADIVTLKTNLNLAVTDIGTLNTKLNLSVTDIASLVTKLNQGVTDIATLTARVNQLRVDMLALRASCVTVAGGTIGGVTESGVTVTANVATLAVAAKSVFNVKATTGTVTGVVELVSYGTPLVTKQAYFDDHQKITFCAGDAVTACDVVYSKADGSQKASALLKVFDPS